MLNKVEDYILKNGKATNPAVVQSMMTDYGEEFKDGATCRVVTSAPTPTTEGLLGELVMSISGDIYKCVSINADGTYTWLPLSTGTGGEYERELPIVSQEDEGKILQVVNGKWAAAELPKYQGSYSVTPRTTAQNIATTGTYLSDDVIVEAIPYAEVSNNANGTTVTIA